MSTPVLWILIPLGLGGLLLLVGNRKAIALIACLATLFLTLCAWLLPIDVVLTIKSWSFRLTPAFEVLGRRLILSNADRSILALVYGSVFFWFIIAATLRIPRRTIPLGLIITSLLVASLAVEPFLYSALIIETAVLLAVPLLSPPGLKGGRGLARFLILQTLAMLFILFSGWLLAGIEANPGDLGLVSQAAILLGFGFVLLLAIFPFHTWIPLLAEEAHPFMVIFFLWIFSTLTMFFGLGFLDHYTWLRDSPFLNQALTAVGVLMVLSGGLLVAFQRHLGRILGYAVIMETGFSFLAISLGGAGLNTFLMLFVPRTLSLGLWVLALSILKEHDPDLTLENIKGKGRIWPLASTGLLLANLSLAGMPLLAGFPVHQAIWEGLAANSLLFASLTLFGGLGLVVAVLRTLSALIAAPEGAPWEVREGPPERIIFVIGWLALFLLGLFPQWALPLWTRLPAIFQHLGQ